MSMFENDDRLRKVRIKLILRIPEDCSEGTVFNSLRQKLEASFNRVPIFQVYFNGLGTQLWAYGNWTPNWIMEQHLPKKRIE